MDYSYELRAMEQGFKIICGVDEAGRGPLAGPVYAAAVILPTGLQIPGLNDSKKLSEKKIPTFGICLGHQLLALAHGAKTHKLKYGHRGANQPAENLETGRVYITSQNHGYAVQCDNLPSFAKLAFYNSNDKTCEGITYTDIPAFSVQFHPEACGGPHDTNFLFDKFIQNILTNKEAK